MPQVSMVKPNGVRIRELRLDLGLTPEQLGKRCATKRHGSTIRRLERGCETSEIIVAQVARALKVKLADVIQCSEMAA